MLFGGRIRGRRAGLRAFLGLRLSGQGGDGQGDEERGECMFCVVESCTFGSLYAHMLAQGIEVLAYIF